MEPRPMLRAICLGPLLWLCAAAALGADAPVNKNAECSRRATERGLTGEARDHFLMECRHPQHARTCTGLAKEKNLRGEARRQFLIDCLKTKGGPGARVSRAAPRAPPGARPKSGAAESAAPK